MYCPSCGQPIAGPGAFCAKCGAQAPGYAAPPSVALRQPRVPGRVQTLAILWFVFGAYRAITGVFAALVLTNVLPRVGIGQWGIPGESAWGLDRFPFLTVAVGAVLVHTAVIAILSFVAGYGLTIRAPWGRVLAIIASVVALIRPIMGTALGIYTLWVLAPSASRVEYEAISAGS